MMRVLLYFFAVLGVIFFLLLSGIAYLVIADPFNVRPLFNVLSSSAERQIDPPSLQLDAGPADTSIDAAGVGASETVDSHPLLNESQEAVLEAVGIDPASLPSSVSTEQEQCFLRILGAARVSEIAEGAAPSASELFAVAECL